MLRRAEVEHRDVAHPCHEEDRPNLHRCVAPGSTKKIIDYVQELDSPHFLLLTECSMADNIIAEAPDKDMVRLCSIRCPHMSQITLEDTRDALKYNQYVIEVPEDIRVRAKRSLDRMLEIG